MLMLVLSDYMKYIAYNTNNGKLTVLHKSASHAKKIRILTPEIAMLLWKWLKKFD